MLLRTIALAVAAAALCGPAMGQELKLKGTVFVPVNSAFGQPMKAFVEELNKRGAGKVSATLAGPEAMPPFEMANAIKSGILDFGGVPASYYKQFVPVADIVTLSPLTPKQQRANGAWGILNKLHNEKANLEYVSTVGAGVNFHIYTRKPVEKMEDLKGLKLRSSPNFTPFFQSLGITPVTMAPPEVQTALERGTVDGYGWPSLGVFDMGWAPHTKYRMDPGFWTVGYNIVFNLDRWKGLTAEQRKVIQDTVEWLETDYAQQLRDNVAKELKKQEDAGIKSVKMPEQYSKMAYDSYLASLEKIAPEETKTLLPLMK